MNRDYSSISPSAAALLLSKSLTEIPFAEGAAKIIFTKEERSKAKKNLRDKSFLVRLLHFEHRYWSVDQAVDQAGNSNLLELSSGYSFRGLAKTLQNPDIHYIDTDLDELIDQKEEVLERLLKEFGFRKPANLEIEPLNALDEEEFERLCSKFKPGPVTLVNEGLLVYLDFEEKIRLCAIIRTILLRHGGCWITGDVYIKNKGTIPNAGYAFNQFMKKHQIEEKKFDDFDQAYRFFQDQGFEIKRAVSSLKDKLTSLEYLNLSDAQMSQYSKASRIRETWILTPLQEK